MKIKSAHLIFISCFFSPGNIVCTGYNRLPGATAEQTSSSTVSLVITKDVFVSVSKSIGDTSEIYFGESMTVTFEADGGRIPHYFKVTHGSDELVLYDVDSSLTPPAVTVDESSNTLSYTITLNNVDYDEGGTYMCLSKNKAAGGAVTQNSNQAVILVGKLLADYLSNSNTDIIGICQRFLELILILDLRSQYLHYRNNTFSLRNQVKNL